MKRFIIAVAVFTLALPSPLVFVSASTIKSITSDTDVRSGSFTLPENTQKNPKNLNNIESKSDETLGEKSAFVPGQVIVKFKESRVDLDKADGLTKSRQFGVNKNLDTIENVKRPNLAVYQTRGQEKTEDIIARLKSDPNVESVQPNFQYSPSVIATDDTSRGLLWGLDNTGQTVNGVSGSNNDDINAPEAWAINEGTNGTSIVAIIDSGVAYNHPDLSANMWDGSSCKDDSGAFLGGCNHGYDYEDNDKIPLPTNSSHGTHIAGTIAAAKNNTKGIIGVAPQSKIMAIKADLTTASIIKGINFAQQNGAKIINASWDGPTNDPALKSAIDTFSGLFITAAGNSSLNHNTTPAYPCDFDSSNIICVAATDQNDALASFSDYGATSVDVSAPGVNILSTVAESNVMSENFNSITVPNVPAGWTKTGDWGTYDFSGNKVLYGDNNHIPYVNNANSLATSPVYNLGSSTGAAVGFLAHCDTEYTTTAWFDYMALEVSGDGSNYTQLARWDEAALDNDTNPDNASPTRNLVFQLPTNSLTTNFNFRFRWFSDSSNVPVQNYDGCRIDDISLTKFADGSNELYAYSSGTSMATPHVAGLAALLWGYKPTLSSAEIKTAILNSGDAIASLNSKTVTGKRINAQKALQTVDPTKVITSFSIPTATSVINETNHTIAVTVPFGTDVTALVPTIVITGASVSPASGVAQNFTTPQTYIVTAADSSTQSYIVSVSISADPDLALLVADKNALVDASIKGTNVDLAHITTTLTNPLPATGSNGSVITWTSNATGVVSNDGQTVVRPAFGSPDAPVVLTAHLTKGTQSDTKDFALTVLAETTNPDIALLAADKAALYRRFY